jgi:hypothetical protein
VHFLEVRKLDGGPGVGGAISGFAAFNLDCNTAIGRYCGAFSLDNVSRRQ